MPIDPPRFLELDFELCERVDSPALMLISPLPEARFIELLAMRLEAIDCDDSVVEVDFALKSYKINII